MSARDDLLAIFDAGGCNDPRFTFEEVADRILNTHAHELAEQIRRNEVVDVHTSVRTEYGHGLHAAADLIDPSVGPVRPDEEPTT